MSSANPPPSLKDLAAEAKGIVDGLEWLRAVTPAASELSRQAAEILANIELHTRAQRAMFDALLLAAEASKLAAAGRKEHGNTGVGVAFFEAERALQKLADQVQDRMRHEATRKPEDFR